MSALPMSEGPLLRYTSRVADIWEGDARQVAERLETGSCSLAILDGPYAMGKAHWDRMKVEELPEWYAPHLNDVSRVCGASASLYVWNTAEGWATLHPHIVARGWTFRALVVWDKTLASLAGRLDTGAVRTWPDTTEVCGFYQREAWAPGTCAGQEVAYAAGADERNPMPRFFASERVRAGMSGKTLCAAIGAHGEVNHGGAVSNWEKGFNYPSLEQFEACAAAMHRARPLADGERPYLVHPSCWPGGDGLRATYDHLRAEYDHLRAEYDHLRAEYEASRPWFEAPMSVGNVWTHEAVAGAERLRDGRGATLHCAQKPLAFAERMLRASMRPGEVCWVPFGGTCREAVAAEWLARSARGVGGGGEEAPRRVVTAELNQDGVDYIGAAIRQIEGGGTRPPAPGQLGLFGASGLGGGAK